MYKISRVFRGFE